MMKRLLIVMLFVYGACSGPPAGRDPELVDAKIDDAGQVDAELLALPDTGVKAALGPVTLDCLCTDTAVYPFCAAVSCLSRRDSDAACSRLCKGMGARSGVAMTCQRGCA